MKKFISMVMAAAMVVSLVPATAFAAGGNLYAEKVTKVIGDLEVAEDFTDKQIGDMGIEGLVDRSKAPEVQIYLDELDVNDTDAGSTSFDVTYTLTNADFAIDGYSDKTIGDDSVSEAEAHTILLDNLSLNGTLATVAATNYGDDDMVAGWKVAGGNAFNVKAEVKDYDDNEVTFKLTVQPGDAGQLKGAKELLKDAVLSLDLFVIMDDTNAGKTATVEVTSDIIDADTKEPLVFIEVKDTGLEATVKKVLEFGVEEEKALKADLKIESEIDNIVDGQWFELKLSKGFEFITLDDAAACIEANSVKIDENVAEFLYDGSSCTEFTIDKEYIIIEAVDAEPGDVCTLTVKTKDTNGGFDAKAAAIEVAKVVEDIVKVTVDEDEDVPVMYSGVDADNKGLTADDDEHWTLVVTAEETAEDAWDFKDAFDVELPEGVFVTDVEVTNVENVTAWNSNSTVDTDTVKGAFAKAYDKGGQTNVFEFGRKAMDAKDGETAKVEFKLELVAEPGFEGDVVLKMAEQEVTVAKFVAPYKVEAAANDLVIDYRYTEVPTEIVVTEAEAGLWGNGVGETQATFIFGFDRPAMDFEEDPEVTVDEASEMEIKDVTNAECAFKVDEESDEEAAVVTISEMSLYMDRSIPAGAYDLMLGGSLIDGYMEQDLFAKGYDSDSNADVKDVTTVVEEPSANVYNYVVKEGFVNVITAGRDQDDASFTKKVVVPVGEAYIVAGEDTVTLDVPAYVSAAGYTMLPVRAVAVALGINNNNVLWDQATKTVTILYGQRIITMTVGAKAINVNGSAIPASASPEVVDGRTFLPMRDLATALGVTDITWDAATKTATLNGNK